MSAIIGEKVQLACDLTWGEPPNIVWNDNVWNMDRNPALIYNQDGINPKHQKKDNYEVDPETFSLTIKKVTLDDSGEVFCESVVNETTTLSKKYLVAAIGTYKAAEYIVKESKFGYCISLVNTTVNYTVKSVIEDTCVHVFRFVI